MEKAELTISKYLLAGGVCRDLGPCHQAVLEKRSFLSSMFWVLEFSNRMGCF